MQCNHSFCTPSFPTYGQCYHCNTVNSCKSSRPEIVGEGDVTTLVLPDGSTQMYFVPASPSNKCCQPATCNPVFGNWPQNTFQSQPIWFIRSISNPVAYPSFQTQQSPPCGFPCPAIQSFDCRGNVASPPPQSTQLQFHNDTCTSTSDLQYFFPQRTCLKVSNNCGACIQASAPIDVGTCCSTMVKPDQNVSTNADVQTSNKLIDCNCSQSSYKKNKSKKRKKPRYSSCSSSDRKSRKKDKKKKTVCECSLGSASDMSVELSCVTLSSETRPKSCSSCTSCQSVFKNTGKKEKKIKNKKRSKTKKGDVSSSQSYVSCTSNVTPTTSQTSCCKSDENPTPSRTSTSSKKELKLKKQKEKKAKKQKEKKLKKEKRNKSTSSKSSGSGNSLTNTSLSTSSCSMFSKQSTSSKDENKKNKKEKKVKEPKIKKEKKMKEHKNKKEKKVKEPKIKKEKKEKQSKSNKKEKEKKSKVKKSKKEDKLRDTTENIQQRTIEESKDLNEYCAQICSSLQGSCTCCSSLSFLKNDFCCMTSMEKCLDMNCIFEGGPSSDMTSYLIEQNNPETACKVVLWYPLENEHQTSSLAAIEHSSLT